MNYEVPSYQESINVLVKFTQFNYKFMVIEKLKINLRILDTFIFYWNFLTIQTIC